MKDKVLIIFKYPRFHWNTSIIKQFSNYYETDYLCISNYNNKNYTELLDDINNLIKAKNIQIVIFDVDFFRFINFFFIEKINSKKKIIITGDDLLFHELNAITASACDLVLTGCPLSVLKYKEKGHEAFMIQFEIDHDVIKNINKDVKKEIDVLFYGSLTPDRENILNYIAKEGILIKNVGFDPSEIDVEDEELLKLISKSKIIINLSKSRTEAIKSYSSEKIYKFYYQFKARIITAGLYGSACVSEYSPGQELFFKEDEILTFFTKEECVKILKKLLKDDELLKKYTKKFTSKVYDLCDKKNFLPIREAIDKPNNRRVKLIKFPYWYLRIAAKQIILRNIKLSNIIKSIFQFKEIFKIIRNSNFLIKFLIIFETIINLLWYSFTLTIKSKKF